MILLDTDAVSNESKRVPDPNAAAWLASQVDGTLFLSVVTIDEIEYGIAKISKSGKEVAAQKLCAWRDGLVHRFSSRILPVTIEVSKRCGRLRAELGHGGYDILIAATAIEHGLVVATRNMKHFGPTGVSLVNPWT
ncbi:MAG: type II toxin-antitoxin system VapC family toxin [Hyphomonadaceae bacterium]|nr:MAG: PilT protein-like protein [Caulobacteraceae bacterium]MBT9447071.1 type II toxin-antitoxin system VapC family toxin [Hyphomonadaceae bacterium]TPW05005.1 MAG: PilT protein-like protein [Alphaproteobacteria bacterium]